jgi:hypothetical protein
MKRMANETTQGKKLRALFVSNEPEHLLWARSFRQDNSRIEFMFQASSLAEAKARMQDALRNNTPYDVVLIDPKVPLIGMDSGNRDRREDVLIELAIMHGKDAPKIIVWSDARVDMLDGKIFGATRGFGKMNELFDAILTNQPSTAPIPIARGISLASQVVNYLLTRSRSA